MKIMLVDDNDISNFIMKKFLERQKVKADIVEYISPEAALENIEKDKPDLLFLDLQMPKINGWQFLENMKQRGVSTKTVILTSSTSHWDKERTRDFSEVIFYAEKPMEEVQLKKLLSLTELDNPN